MEITPDRILEEFLDDLAMGDLGRSVESFNFMRLGPGSVRLDYGEAGSFILTVQQES